MALPMSLMAVFGQSQPRPGLTAAYDAYNASNECQQSQHQHHQPHSHHHAHSPNQQQNHQPHGTHNQQQQQQQPWYDVSDGAATPPDETSSHRDSRITGPITGARRVSCHVTIMAAVEVFIIAAMAILEYLLRMTDVFPVREIKFNCYDSSISSNADVDNNTFSVLTDSTSSSREATFLVCFCFPPLLMAISELILWTTSRHEQFGMALSRHCLLSLSFRRITRFTGTYVFGILVVMIVTDNIKLMTGRLRPDFLDVCQLNWTVCETNPVNALHSASEVCLQTNVHVIQQARKSFPSMQASVTAYASFFVAIYVHHVICCGRKVNILRPFLSLSFVFMSVMCCVASHTVQRNHFTDIAAGFVIGLVMAIYLAVSVLNCFTERLSPSRLYTRLDRALGVMHCSVDDLDSSTHGDVKSRSSSSSAGTEWRCSDSTSARSWSHFAVHHLTPLHPAVSTSTSGLVHKVLE